MKRVSILIAIQSMVACTATGSSEQAAVNDRLDRIERRLENLEQALERLNEHHGVLLVREEHRWEVLYDYCELVRDTLTVATAARMLSLCEHFKNDFPQSRHLPRIETEYVTIAKAFLASQPQRGKK